MKTLSRILSLVISLQLAVGCSGSQLAVTGAGVSGGLGLSFLSGSIASFEMISNAIMPTAMAAGDLTVYTLDPKTLEREEAIYSETVKGASIGHKYNIEIPAEHQGKLMEVHFKDADVSIVTKQEFTYVPTITTKENQEVVADLSQAGTLEAIVTKALLAKAIDDGINAAEIPDKLQELKLEDKKEIFQMLGADNKAILTQLILNVETADTTLKYIVEYSSIVAKEGVVSASKLATDLLLIGLQNNFIEKSQQMFMFCTRTDVQFYLPQEKYQYYLYIDTTDPDLMYAEFAYIGNVKTVADELIRRVRETGLKKNLTSLPNLVFSQRADSKSDSIIISSCPIYTSGVAPLDESVKAAIKVEEAIKFDLNILRDADASRVVDYYAAQDFYMKAISAGRVEMRQRLSSSGIAPDRWDALIEEAAIEAQRSMKDIIEYWRMNRVRYEVKYFDAVSTKDLKMAPDKLSGLLKEAFSHALKDVDERLIALVGVENSKEIEICYDYQKELALAEMYSRYEKWEEARIAAGIK